MSTSGELPATPTIRKSKILSNRSVDLTSLFRSGCSESKLDLDNTRGGNNGVETITLHDTPDNVGNVYMVFVQVLSFMF